MSVSGRRWLDSRRRRAVDVVGAVTLGLLFAPVWVPVAALVRLADGPPTCHRAIRIGRDGEPFTLHKFRTMRAAPGAAITVAGDTRVTCVGGWLRRWKLDELPQLWDVLRGDMSLVGPRPEDATYVQHYTDAQRALLAVRPGITGVAAIAFRDEESLLAGFDDAEHAYLTSVLPAKLALELEWLERASPAVDLRVIAQTIAAVAGWSR